MTPIISLSRRKGRSSFARNKSLVHFEIIDGEYYGYLLVRRYRKFLIFYWYEDFKCEITAGTLMSVKQYMDDLWEKHKKEKV